MKQLANYLKIMPFADFESFDGTDLIGSSAADLLPSLNDLVFNEPPKTERAGTLYEQSLEVITKKLSSDLRERYPERMKVVALLYDDANLPTLWGGDAYSVRISITPKADRDVITITRKATEPLF